jgi:hypothetical protein
MGRRTAAWLAWFLCALSLALTALSLLFLALNLSHPNTPIYNFWLENTVLPNSFSKFRRLNIQSNPKRAPCILL